jgi:nicotinamidase-related amidase
MSTNHFVAPDYGHIALITIDVQSDTLDGHPLEIPGTSAMLPRLRELIAAFREAAEPVAHVVRLYKPDGSNADLCRRHDLIQGAQWLRPGSMGAQLAPGLVSSSVQFDCDRLLAGEVQQIGPNEHIMYKPRWGAFYQTPLEGFLRAKSVTTLVFAGCNFPNCPRTSIYEASERDFRIVLASDAISGFYERGAAELANIGVTIEAVPDIVSSLHRRKDRGARLQGPSLAAADAKA